MFVQETAVFALQFWQRIEGHGKSDQVLENGSSFHSDERGKRVRCLNRCLLGYFIETLGSPFSPTGSAEKPLTMSFRTRSRHLRQPLFLSLSTYGKLSIACSVPGAWKEQLCFFLHLLSGCGVKTPVSRFPGKCFNLTERLTSTDTWSFRRGLYFSMTSSKCQLLKKS